MNGQDRRVFNETKELKENYNDININIKKNFTELIAQDPRDNKYPKVKFVMNGNYPFSPPSVYVFIDGKETSYLKTIVYHSCPRIIKCITILKKIGYTIINCDCLCCNSILCEYWSPACDFTKIIDEIMKINYIKKQVKTLLGINSLGKKYGLSHDIEVYIYKFLY
jgi:ubiquitin-protein ligase